MAPPIPGMGGMGVVFQWQVNALRNATAGVGVPLTNCRFPTVPLRTPGKCTAIEAAGVRRAMMM